VWQSAELPTLLTTLLPLNAGIARSPAAIVSWSIRKWLAWIISVGTSWFKNRGVFHIEKEIRYSTSELSQF
jgi:hypothetical protein